MGNSRINKKKYLEIQSKIFKKEKECIVQEEKDREDIISKIKNYVKEMNKKIDYRKEFSILEGYSEEKVEDYSSESYNKRYNKEIMIYASLKSKKDVAKKAWIKIGSSPYTHQNLVIYIYFDKKNKLVANIILYNRKKFNQIQDRKENFDKCIENDFLYSTNTKQIIEFIDLVMETHKKLEDEAKSKKIKKNKVKELKEKTIEAKIKEIMKEKKLIYRTETKNTAMFLFIKLGKSKVLEIKIKFKKFHTTLQRLSDLIDELIELYKQGIEVKHKTVIDRHQSWIYLEGVEKDD